MNDLDLSALRYHLIPPRGEDPEAERRARIAYDLWSEVWLATLQELDGAERVPSDNFTRQDLLGCLFVGDECLGMTAYRWIDLGRAQDRRDSYFEPWPETALKSLGRDGPRVCVGSHLTLSPAWRSRLGGISMKRLLLALAVEHFLDSPADVMAGVMRNDRGMNEIGYELGAQSVARDLTFHNVGVDLVAFYRGQVKQLPDPENARLVRELWARHRKESKKHAQHVA